MTILPVSIHTDKSNTLSFFGQDVMTDLVFVLEAQVTSFFWEKKRNRNKKLLRDSPA